jgi:mannose-1-phosphate guanylyltransferase
MFVWTIPAIRKAIQRHLQQLHDALEFLRPWLNHPSYRQRLAQIYRRLKTISIDLGVMERAKERYCVIGRFAWRDLGSWQSVAAILPRDRQGNTVQGQWVGIDTTDTLIVGEPEHLIGTIGVKDLIVVSTDHATLVCHRDRAEEVKQLVERLQQRKAFQRFL